MSYDTATALPLGSAVTGAAVVKSDSTILSGVRCLYVGVAGDLVVTFPDDTSVTILAAAVGYHPLAVKKVNAATAATNIIALG